MKSNVGEQHIRFMTFNVKYDNAYKQDCENSWSRRSGMVASMIRYHQIDVVGTQEALRHQVADLEQMLPEFGWIGAGRDDGADTGEFVAIFYRKNRLEPLEYGTFWLSETPEIPGKLGWDAACPRILTWVQFMDKLTGTKFIHFNTHLDHIGTVAMKQSAHMILNRIPELAGNGPVVVTGDFNCTESSEPYQILTTGKANGKAVLRDSRYAAKNSHIGPSFTFHGYQLTQLINCLYYNGPVFKGDNGEELDSPIDYVFVNEHADVLQYAILSDQDNGQFPSDHLPVVVDLTWR